MERLVTGQVEFDSHTSSVVTSTVTAVNALAPGWARGREFPLPSDEAAIEAIRSAFPSRSRHAYDPVPANELAELRGYVAELWSVFQRRDTGDLDGACQSVNSLLARTGAVPVLSRHDNEPWHLHFHAMDATWARSYAGPMATALAMVLGSAMADRLGVCSASHCDRVYVDTSRNGAKRFCSTACQNRVKAATFRERRRT